ncbi:matrix metalloproteinase-19-like [Trichechus manatus latirostris]|uniref:Matrix metalloproteinase-19-like n=1 Tax=Trichechus manatus latirostris TaxID=127582 RepID=A0A2Y9R9Z9_TRIMA|nr:matrix metalloproteinase-19-like [Trichechus manatus latirostris]
MGGEESEAMKACLRHPQVSVYLTPAFFYLLTHLLLSGPHGKTYAFKGDYVWTVTDSGLGPLFPVSALWEGLPGNLDAAVYSPRTQRTHFFKGNKVWRYINFKMSPGFPKMLNRIEPNLDAALYWPLNKKVFLFKGSGYWQWDELARTDFSSYPKPIKGLFTGVPDRPSAAVSWRDDRVYFFKGKHYWRLNQQLRVEKGYPRDTAQNWMHCHPQSPDTTPQVGTPLLQ